MAKSIRITIHGRVHGVWFRQSAMRMAVQLGITGFVRNEPDGTVYIEAEGNDNALFGFITWCHSGPELAEVSHVSIEEQAVKHYTQFEVLR
ncbi:acylphosphatase [Sphingobacteriales bacterium UPWRP_1]|nr:hypothetical protein BVG80_13535 [Sphingobacteriales bacterium TSM_CSM]PSJ74413.1 acylphosphatase [Sphingobacteriales bacterium UPWRP_1]